MNKTIRQTNYCAGQSLKTTGWRSREIRTGKKVKKTWEWLRMLLF